MAQFRVVLDSVELSREQHDELDRALQQTTLSFVAKLDSRGDERAYYMPKILRPPLGGIWIREIEGELVEQFNEQADLRASAEKLNAEIAEGGGL